VASNGTKDQDGNGVQRFNSSTVQPTANGVLGFSGKAFARSQGKATSFNGSTNGNGVQLFNSSTVQPTTNGVREFAGDDGHDGYRFSPL
jgi:hypothetical protein